MPYFSRRDRERLMKTKEYKDAFQAALRAHKDHAGEDAEDFVNCRDCLVGFATMLKGLIPEIEEGFNLGPIERRN